MPALGSVIAQTLARWAVDDLPLERIVLGTQSPDKIAGIVDGWCRAHLGSAIDHYRFFESSIGSVHGVRLADGRDVVVKLHGPAVPPAFLAVVVAVQHDLAEREFPAPVPLGGPAPIGIGLATAEAMVEQTIPADTHAPAVRRAVARGLADFVSGAAGFRDQLAPVAPSRVAEPGALYPPPHSPRFDFAATAEGAEWIDELARAAQARLDAAPTVEPIVAHGDWRVQNLSIAGDRIVAVYDWDSIGVIDEVHALGTAALTFSVDWNSTQSRRFPTPPEMAAFIATYEHARDGGFDRPTRDRLAASMVASLAYGARCEHAVRDVAPDGTDSQRGLLAELGSALLDVGLDVLER